MDQKLFLKIDLYILMLTDTLPIMESQCFLTRLWGSDEKKIDDLL